MGQQLGQLQLDELDVIARCFRRQPVEVSLAGSLRYGVQWAFFGGKADARSMIAAVKMAADMADARFK